MPYANFPLGGGVVRERLLSLDLTPLLVSEASRVQLPLQHTPLATCLSTRCVDGRGSSLIPTVWNVEQGVHGNSAGLHVQNEPQREGS